MDTVTLPSAQQRLAYQDWLSAGFSWVEDKTHEIERQLGERWPYVLSPNRTLDPREMFEMILWLREVADYEWDIRQVASTTRPIVGLNDPEIATAYRLFWC